MSTRTAGWGSPSRHGFPMPRGGGQDLPHARRLSTAKASRHGARAKGFARAGTLPSAKASRHGARAKGFVPRRNTPLDEGLPTRRTSEGICPHEKALLGESLPTRRTGERICPAQKHAPRRRPPDTARRRRDLPHARRLSSAKASRHGARAKRFAPREKALLGEGLPTRRTSERICPAQKHAPRRRPPDTARRRKDLPAQERSPRRRPPNTAHERKDLPRGVRPRPTCRRTAGRPRPTDSRKNTPSAGSHPRGRGRCRVHSPKKNKTTP